MFIALLIALAIFWLVADILPGGAALTGPTTAP
jgi:hypothetical protein